MSRKVGMDFSGVVLSGDLNIVTLPCPLVKHCISERMVGICLKESNVFTKLPKNLISETAVMLNTSLHVTLS